MGTLINRYVANYSGKFMSTLDEISLVETDKTRFNDYDRLLLKLHARDKAEYDHFEKAVIKIQSKFRKNTSQLFNFIVDLMEESKKKKEAQENSKSRVSHRNH